MAWVRTDENAPNHPKFFRAGVAAYGFWHACLSYCNRWLTDGHIPGRDLALCFPGTPPGEVEALTEILVREGLLEVAAMGYRMHDYHHYQPTRKAVLYARRQRAASGREGGRKTAETFKHLAAAGAQGLAGLPTRPDPTRPGSTRRRRKDTTTTPPMAPRAGEATPANGARPWPSPEALVERYNAETPDECPAVTVLSAKRRAKAQGYLRSFPAQDFWQRVFAECHRSSFLRGQRKNPGHESFVATFDWLLSTGKDGTENVVKVAEGTYRDGPR